MSTSPPSLPIKFFYQEVEPTLTHRTKLKQFLQNFLRKQHRSLISLNYIFTTDQEVLKINRNFLQHDYYTDIITFDLGNPEGVEAEIYISVDRVRDNARKIGISFKEELHRVIFHGVLHLCGYTDKSKKDARSMREAEDELLKKYFSRST